MSRIRFVNPHQKRIYRSAGHFLLWQVGYYREKISLPCIPQSFTYPNPIDSVDQSLPQVTWVNHSTFWIKANQKSILIDPIWNSRCSPIKFLGPKRKHSPSLLLEELGAIDYVIISHNHYDHLDKKTVYHLHQLYPDITWIVPLGVKKWFLRHLVRVKKELVVELNWWERVTFDTVNVTAVPAQHFSGRGFFDRNRSLWMGFVVSFGSEKRFYFAGDTGYNPVDFKEIGKRLGPFDLSLIPIGVYSPRRFMKPVHVNPCEALLIHKDIGSKLSIASHWGTFRLSNEELHQPPYDLYCALRKTNLEPKEFRVLTPGQSLNW